ncbi:MAG: hypothetical protein V8S32_06705 [Lachnospiraceae bacterium]
MKPSVSRILRASFFFKFVDWLTNEKNLSGEIWLTNEKSLSGEMRIDFQSRIMYDDDARVKISDADRVCTGRHLSLKLYMLYAACKEPFD